MKAHLNSPVSEQVLLYAIPADMRPQLTEVLEKLSIRERYVTDAELGQSVGYLAGFPAFLPASLPFPNPLPDGAVLCMCSLSGKRINALLKALVENGISIPLKAVVTATNQSWSFGNLIVELAKERQALAQRKDTAPRQGTMGEKQ